MATSRRFASYTPTSATAKNAEHDNMLKQAIYNTGANVFVVLAGFGVVALYWVLESFFRPLTWAMLCGAFLHPFKYQVTESVKSWLSGLRGSGTPFTLGVFKIPFDLLDTSSETLIHSLQRRWRVIAVVTGVFLTLYIAFHQAPLDIKQFTAFVFQLYTTLSNFVSLISFKWVCALVVSYLIAVIRFWSPEYKPLLSYLSIPIWLLTMLCIIANSGAFRLPLAMAIIMLMVVGFYTDYAHRHGDDVSTHVAECESEDARPVSPVPELSMRERWYSFSNLLMASMQPSATTVSGEPAQDESFTQPEELDPDDKHLQIDPRDNPATNAEATLHPPSPVSGEDSTNRNSEADDDDSDALCNNHTGVVDLSLSSSKACHSSTPFRKSFTQYLDRTSSQASTMERMKNRRRSDKCFIFLFWAIVLVLLWSNVWLMLLPLISFAYRLLKMLVQRVHWFFTTKCKQRFSEDLEPARVWCTERLDVIVPAPIRGITKFILKGDSKVVEVLVECADSIITVVLILLLLVGFVLLSVGVCFQVQKEGVHLVTLTSSLIQNRTVQPQWLTDVLRDGGINDTAAIHSSLDPMIKNLYSFGREWIVKQISERISHHSSRLLVETELVGIWDSLYESWVTKNTTMLAKPDYDGALFSHITNGGFDIMSPNVTVDVSGIFNFVRENIGIFQSVVESVWILLKGNVNLAFTLLISVLQIILGGGSAILNSFLSLIVFFTTLFYLLASSSDDYKPVEWISKLTIAKTGSKFAQAVEDGIGGVFAATLKMAAFYGVYTWLTHTVFGTNIVFLPSVFAAVLGAIPFVGTYWAALPAILELSLIHGEVFLGILLACFHILPTFVVDTALYSDIKGGGHPYLTGLAIAGGIYCFGLQGAIVGPVLLCCIIVSTNVYSAMINSPAVTPATPGSHSLPNRTGVNRPVLKRSMSSNNYTDTQSQ